MNRAAFLDRDGVVNVDHGFVHRWEDFEFLPGVLDAAHRLRSSGYRLFIITNQSGLARGLFDEAEYLALSREIARAFAASGANLDGIYHCPHHPSAKVAALAMNCNCRKPAPGLILRAAAEHNIDLAASLLVGDKRSDIEAGRTAGVGRNFLVRSTNPESTSAAGCRADAEFSSLLDCVNALELGLGGGSALLPPQKGIL